VIADFFKLKPNAVSNWMLALATLFSLQISLVNVNPFSTFELKRNKTVARKGGCC
jgi:hypothetical protein